MPKRQRLATPIHSADHVGPVAVGHASQSVEDHRGNDRVRVIPKPNANAHLFKHTVTGHAWHSYESPA